MLAVSLLAFLVVVGAVYCELLLQTGRKQLSVQINNLFLVICFVVVAAWVIVLLGNIKNMFL